MNAHDTLKTSTVLAALTMATLLTAAPPARAQQDPPNIIFIFTDDMGLADLPFYNPPLEWQDAGNPPDEGEAEDTAEAEMRAPGLNRLFARMLAKRLPYKRAKLSTFGYDPDDNAFTVVPVDLDNTVSTSTLPSISTTTTTTTTGGGTTTTVTTVTTLPANVADFEYTSASPPCSRTNADTWDPDFNGPGDPCNAARDILTHFGGLNKIASNGIVFQRFYASSAKCGPTRGAMMTGRAPARIGLNLNGGQIRPAEVTIAEFLKQGCDEVGERLCMDWTTKDPDENKKIPTLRPCPCYLDNPADCAAAECYVTGLVGKWHSGGTFNTTAPWSQGFDEFFGSIGGGKHYWSGRPFTCSPVTQSYCRNHTDRPCLENSHCEPEPGDDCGGMGEASCCEEPSYNFGYFDDDGTEQRGLYVGDSTTTHHCPKKENGSVFANEDPHCCAPKGKWGLLGKAKYDLGKKELEGTFSEFSKDTVRQDKPGASSG